MSGYGIVMSCGWEKCEDGFNQHFVARIRFPDGPPDLPLSVVWQEIPVRIVIFEPQKAQIE